MVWRCANCKRRLNEGQAACHRCGWEVDPELALRTARNVSARRKHVRGQEKHIRAIRIAALIGLCVVLVIVVLLVLDNISALLQRH